MSTPAGALRQAVLLAFTIVFTRPLVWLLLAPTGSQPERFPGAG